MRLARMGAHPGQSDIERRLWYHFFFHGMYDKVRRFVQRCKDCSLFVDKKTRANWAPCSPSKMLGNCCGRFVWAHALIEARGSGAGYRFQISCSQACDINKSG